MRWRGVTRCGVVAAAVAAPTAVASAEQPPGLPAWSRRLGAGVGEEPYGMPSRHEAHVVRRHVPWLTPDRHASVSFTPLADLHGIITPSGLCFERHHSGVPDIDPRGHRLLVHGLVERELVFTLEELQRLPSVSRIHFLECPANGATEWRGAQMSGVQYTHGMQCCCEWTGVPLRQVLAETGLRPEASWLLAEGADAAHMTRSLPIAKALDDVILAWGQNGEALRPAQGYPLRLVVPGWEGNVWVKWLRRIELGDRPWFHREETRNYTELMPDGRSRAFRFVNEANSVITQPCPERPLHGWGGGFVEISGLAWSGLGAVARVDVSVDGGDTWRTAELQAPVLDRALTRFRLRWEWHEEAGRAFLQSRAVDSAGRVQPTLGALRARRGTESIYHKNAVHTWLVEPDGAVVNVQVDG